MAILPLSHVPPTNGKTKPLNLSIQIWERQTSCRLVRKNMSSLSEMMQHHIERSSFLQTNMWRQSLKPLNNIRPGRSAKVGIKSRKSESIEETNTWVRSLNISNSKALNNLTAGYSPQLNGVAERMNRTLFEMAWTMLNSPLLNYRG